MRKGRVLTVPDVLGLGLGLHRCGSSALLCRLRLPALETHIPGGKVDDFAGRAGPVTGSAAPPFVLPSKVRFFLVQGITLLSLPKGFGGIGREQLCVGSEVARVVCFHRTQQGERPGPTAELVAPESIAEVHGALHPGCLVQKGVHHPLLVHAPPPWKVLLGAHPLPVIVRPERSRC